MRTCVLLWAVVLSFGGGPVANATTILFAASDLPDSTGGEDLWQYSYSISEGQFGANFGFSIGFDHTLYADLADPPPVVNGDWDVISLQPDPALSADGLYDALALVDFASLSDPFIVTFVWLGAGTPGSQPFTVNQFDSDGTLVATLESGHTAVPEPAELALLLGGLVLVAARLKAAL